MPIEQQTAVLTTLFACTFLICTASPKTAFAEPAELKAGGAPFRLNQLGYLPNAPKIAKVVGSASSKALVRRTNDDSIALEAILTDSVIDKDSGDALRTIDFTAVKTPGNYYLEIADIGRSESFAISNAVYDAAFALTMRSYYGQRCGIAVSLAPDFPQFSYPACHTKPAQFHTSSGKAGEIDCAGGWHDAGDYGRYIVNSGITTATLLWAFEFNESKLKNVTLRIPESGGKLPDMLAEIKWNIDWMLKMQDVDGGVWHKATSESFPGFVLPQDDPLPIFVIGSGKAPFKTTAATADFAAVCASASRIYKPYDAAYSEKCLSAARRAWEWIVAHPDCIYDNPPGVHTGGYGDRDCRDECLWAAAELFRATGDDIYNDYFLKHYKQWQPTISADRVQAWPNVENLAMFTYALCNQPGADKSVQSLIRKDTLIAAEQLIKRSAANGYSTPMRSSDYIWGSNSVAANYGMMLLIANHFEPKPEFVHASLDTFHYLLGCNTFGESFVTGLGSRSPQHPHHRPSGTDNVAAPWPGLLVGGPNAEGKLPPAKQWVDEQGDFRRNEVAINWNAPLVFLLAAHSHFAK